MSKHRPETVSAFVATISRLGPTPIYRQIYDRVRHGIASGTLQPGSRLPSARNLASDLGIARGTVEDAYGLLLAEGYIERHAQAGTVIAQFLDDSAAWARLVAPAVASRMPATANKISADRVFSPFQLGQPAFDAFPRAAWARLIARHARSPIAAGAGHPDHTGYFPLRAAIARYLGLSRGVACAPDQVLITNGYQAAIDLLGRSLLRERDNVWFEEPGYPFARSALRATGARLVAVRVDNDGMRVADGMAAAPEARLVVTTPAHQSPLCVALSLPRRLQLLEWARRQKAWILEDDYDGEFHYGGRPLPALKSLDRNDRVIYAGSFSKTLLPELRLGYLVVPLELVDRLTAAAMASSAAPGRLMQAVVCEFLESGHFARHVHRMRQLYAERRGALADALSRAFGDLVTLDVQQGGMHLVARLSRSCNDLAAAKRAAAEGLALQPLSATYMKRTRQRGLLLGFTNVPENKAAALCRKLRRCLIEPVNT
jgi:GntR family transcriptional regulator/MocR family aminotransferase